MADKVNEVLAEKSSISGVIASLTHEESTPSKNVSQPNAENCDKKKLSPDNDDGPTATTAALSAQDKQDIGYTTINNDKELKVEWSDEETIQDTIEAEGDLGDNSALSKKSETFFSDIESSDNSFGYEQEVKVKSTEKVYSNEQTAIPSALEENVCKEEKIIESEFDLVESDEEFFEDPPIHEAKEVISQETISEEEPPWESDGVNEPVEEELKSSTPLIDEENGGSNELDPDLVVAKAKTEKNEAVVAPEVEAGLLKDEDTEAPQVSEDLENVIDDKISTEIPKTDLVDTEMENVDSENALLRREKCSENKTESIEKLIVLSTSVIPAEEDSTTPKVSSKSTTDENLEKLEELTPTDITELDEDSKMMEEVADDPKNTTTPTSFGDKDQLESMVTDDEVAEDLNANADESIETDKKEENATHLVEKDDSAPVGKQLETGESLEAVKTLLKEDEMQTTDDFKMEEEATSTNVSQEELQKPVDEKKILKTTEGPEEKEKLLESDEASGESTTVPKPSVPMVVENILTEIVEKLESHEEKLSELKQSCVNSDKMVEPKSTEDLLETDERGKTIKVGTASDSAQLEKLPIVETEEMEVDDDVTMSSKSIDTINDILDDDKQVSLPGEELSQKPDEGKNSPKPILDEVEKMPEIPIVETEETKDDDVLMMSPRSSDADNQILDKEKQAEPFEKEILVEEIKESIEDLESSQKPNDDKILQENVLDGPEKSPEITQKAGDSTEKELTEPSADKEILDDVEAVPKNIDETLETPDISNEQIEQLSEKKGPQEKLDEIPAKSKPNATESNKTKESFKETVESAEKTDELLTDLKEKRDSPQEMEETSQKPNKEVTVAEETPLENIEKALETSKKSNEPLTDSTEKKESPKEVVKLTGNSEQPVKAENEETSKESVESAKKSAEKDSSDKLLEALNKSDKQEKVLTEKEEPPKEVEESSNETDESLKESNKPKDDETVISSEAVISPKENLATKSVEIPKIATDIIVDKIVEASKQIDTKTSIIAKEPSSAVVEQDANKPARTMDPNIIEIDDDDDDDVLEKQKKLEDNSAKDGRPSSNEKETKEKETEAVTNIPPAKDTMEIDTPMDLDEELMAENSEKPALKPEEEKASKQEVKPNQEFAIIDEIVPLKPNEIPTTVNSLEDEEEETLLVIDTSHKEDNDNESNYMDNETATSAPSTDSSSEGSLEVFYDKECINYECKRETKNFYRATLFTLSFFKISKKRTKIQFVCENCYDRALTSYEDLCKTLKQKQPLLYGTNFKCQEFVEIIDSSDEEESDVGGDKIKDENALPKESIEMLEAELEGAIRKVMYNVDIQNQLTWTKQILQQRLNNLQEDTDFVSDQLRALQKKADNMHNSLYQCPKIKLRQLTPLDLNSGRMYNPESENSMSIPPPGDVIRLPIRVNEEYYAVKAKAIASWVPCKVIEESDSYPMGFNQTKTYKIKFTKQARYPMFKTVYAKHMAYYDPPNVRLPIGSRVIAYFDVTSLSRGKEKMLIPSAFYPGIIAEPLKQSNKFRYLVFYDDGYFQYVNHKDVRLVCQASENVWEDVHHQSREFIHNYLTQYAVNRPMVQTQKGQSMLVDYNGKWIYARVIDVDCSLVQMLFEGQSRSEWIYRGSTRLGPVYKESNNLSQKNTLNATRRRTEPFIRYINGDDSTSSQPTQEPEEPQPKTAGCEIRAVAKKSVSRVDTSNNNSTASNSAQQPVPTVRHLNNSTIFVDDDNKPKGKVVYYTARKNLPPRNFVPHICNPSCPFNVTHNLSFYSPLAKPLLSGWERQVFRQKSKKFIVYRGPCGKRMRSIEELHRYLRITDNELNVDNFDFSPDTNCLAEYVLEKCLVNKKDISCGKEKMPIPCVNYYDETMPPACEYSAERIPTAGVPLNLNEEFMCGCDCEDDCSDKSKCACWELTYAGAKYGMPTVPIEMVGYQFKRLYEHVPTGIYECNSRCKCKANCVNRVVQQPLQSKLQVFKTSNRGWGLRCINDVPRGSFICVYAGQLLTEQVANEGGLDAGDEYFAELDYIEVAEQIKEGYESDVQEPEEEEDIYNHEKDDDDFDFRAPSESGKDKEFTTRLRARRGTKNSTDSEFDSQERQVISFEPNKTMDTSNEPNEKPTIRKLFGRDESCYVMDAKVRGNLGRYFNHSCSPNLFVQNVFVDTHDLRFPWVAFFASTHIRAGTELTWNYNYEVGVVPGKVLYCQCGAPNCRQRLL